MKSYYKEHREERRLYSKKWWQNLSKEKQRVITQRNNKSRSQLSKKRKRKAVEMKGGKCQRCGYNKSLVALEFHHKIPQIDDIQIGKLWDRKWQIIKKELQKCELVCSNCHKVIHWGAY